MKNKKLIKDFDISSFKMSGGMIGGGGSGGSETHEFTTIETFNPTSQTGLIRTSIDTTDVTKGFGTIIVDGALEQTVDRGLTKFRVVDPSTSLSIKSENEGWDISTASYDSLSFSVSSQTGSPQSMMFKDDGTKLYVLANSPDTVFQYSLSTAWDISTASYDSVSFSVTTQAPNPQGLDFKPDGTKMFVVGVTNDTVYQYGLSTPWDLSTASYDSVSLLVQTLKPNGVKFSNDGTKLFTTDRQTGRVYQFSMTTAWDLTTGSQDYYISVFADVSYPEDLWFNNDGSEMFGVNYTNKVWKYNLSTPYELNTAVYGGSKNVSAQEGSLTGIAFKDNGTKLYTVGLTNDTVFQYTSVYPWC